MRESLKKFFAGAAVVGLLFGPIADAKAGGLPLLPSTPQYSEPSQIVGTMNALINQLNGNPLGQGGYAAQPNNAVSLGSFCSNTAAGSPVTCNGQRGAALFTGITVAATGTTQNIVINDSSITAASACNATLGSAFTAGSGVGIATAVPAAGTLTLTLVNAGTTTNAVTTATVDFNCFN